MNGSPIPVGSAPGIPPGVTAGRGTFNKEKTPFPWFGGKSRAAESVWTALGDVPHYVEPFAGGLAVLLRRPHLANRPYFSETVNDLDGLLVNFWRAVQADPDGVAESASWPVSELDKHARSCELLRWRDQEMPALLAGSPDFYDTRMAGWWAWAVSCQIAAWGTGGPWWPDETGRLRKRGARGVPADRPHLANNGQGVNHAAMREPGVGVRANLPHLGDDGQGVNRPQLREPGVGVWANRPHLGNDGQGVNRPQLREPGVGVWASRPQVGTARGVNHAGLREPGVADVGMVFHETTMPRLREWLRFLSARLRHVRILSGDWSRLVTTGASFTLPVRNGHGPVGIFLDPPYAHAHRKSDNIYAQESATVADDVRAWCLANGDLPKRRIVLAGYDTEHTELEDHGWTVTEWFTDGYLTGGMGNVGGDHDQKRERLWLSPHCLAAEEPDWNLFDDVTA